MWMPLCPKLLQLVGGLFLPELQLLLELQPLLELQLLLQLQLLLKLQLQNKGNLEGLLDTLQRWTLKGLSWGTSCQLTKS